MCIRTLLALENCRGEIPMYMEQFLKEVWDLKLGRSENAM